MRRLGELLRTDPGAIDADRPLASYGLGSAQAAALAGELEDWLGRRLAPTLVYEHPTIAALARHLAGKSAPAPAPEAPRVALGEPIAIIGIGCRFPGARSPEAFWRLLCEGRDAVAEIPADRWDRDAYYDPDPKAPGRMNTRWGGFLDGVDRFDASFFEISPREAARMDPQQRLLLEVAWEALEDAGLARERLAGAPVGVFVGIATNDYGRLLAKDPALADAYGGTGNALSIAANRLSYFLDLCGPSLAVDTACSSSLVAVHLACQSLRLGECELALVGGVNLILTPEVTVNFSKAGFMAADGRCKAFDARADGYVRGEGCGVVVLKPLARALADGDPVYAVIRGSAINQDGRSNGLTAPSRPAQEAVLRAAYRQAGVAPGRVQYVEAHGTGTPLGDPIEAAALGTVLGEGRPADRPCALGSVKTNVGHLEAAAGVAGLIKTALALRHRALPPNLHWHAPNPHIPFGELRLRVQQTLTPWPAADGPALAGVSSFGFGGTNAHVVLEGPPAAAPEPARPAGAGGALLALSARAPEALKDLARAYRTYLKAHPAAWADVCFSAGARRSHHAHRLALEARDAAEAVEKLDAFLRGEPALGLAARRVPNAPAKVAFIFSGQGANWWGMGRELLDGEPVFRAALEECDGHLRPLIGASVLDVLRADEDDPRLEDPGIAQPALFAVQVALAAVWRSWGVVPAAVVGHSLGEVAAAHVAGILDLADAAQVVAHRGRLMRRVAGRGKTAAVEVALDEARPVLAGFNGHLSVAAVNSPISVTVAGEPDAVEGAVAAFRGRDVLARVLPVNCAFHSHQLEALKGELAAALDGLRPRRAAVPFFSTVTGGELDGTALGPDYWGRNLRETVRFVDAVAALATRGFTAYVEIGAHPVLARPLGQCLGKDAVILASLRKGHEERAALLGALGALYTLGQPIDWRGVTPNARFVPLPTYPWQHERYWLDATAAPAPPATAAVPPPERPMEEPAPVRRRLEAAPPGERRAALLDYLRERVGTVLQLAPARVDPAQPLASLGLVSIMAMELKSSAEADLGVKLPVAQLVQGPTLDHVADLVLAQMA